MTPALVPPEVIVGDPHQAPAPEDVVVSSAVLHFARDESHFRSMLAGTWRLLAPGGAFVGMEGFGASAPAEELFAHFDITAEAEPHVWAHNIEVVRRLPDVVAVDRLAGKAVARGANRDVGHVHRLRERRRDRPDR